MAAAPPVPAAFATVSGVVREIALFCPPASLCALRQLNSCCFDALDDSIWRHLCLRVPKPAPVGQHDPNPPALKFDPGPVPPRPYPSFEHLFRAQLPGVDTRASQAVARVEYGLREWRVPGNHTNIVAHGSASALGWRPDSGVELTAAVPDPRFDPKPPPRTTQALLLAAPERVDIGVVMRCDAQEWFYPKDLGAHEIPFPLPGMILSLSLAVDPETPSSNAAAAEAPVSSGLRLRAAYSYRFERKSRKKLDVLAVGTEADETADETPISPTGDGTTEYKVDAKLASCEPMQGATYHFYVVLRSQTAAIALI